MGPHEERAWKQGGPQKKRKKQQQKRTIAGDQKLLVGMQVVATLAGFTAFPRSRKIKTSSFLLES